MTTLAADNSGLSDFVNSGKLQLIDRYLLNLFQKVGNQILETKNIKAVVLIVIFSDLFSTVAIALPA